jgi:hypothetical protein
MNKANIARFACFLAAVMAAALSGCVLTKEPGDSPTTQRQSEPAAPTPARVPEAPPVLAAPVPVPPPPVKAAPADGPLKLEVYKGRRELVVKKGERLVERYEVRLGRHPHGHKQAQGDMKTPEGSYRICRIKPSKYQSFLWISYPNEQDAKRALEAGMLTQSEYERIVAALRDGECPPYNTRLGGVVGIHGDYEEPARRYNWTEGCIALANNGDLFRLKTLVKPGTEIVIHP